MEKRDDNKLGAETILRLRRKDLGYSQAQFCRIANLHQSAASALERGYRRAGVSLQQRVSKALNLDPDMLFDDRGFARLAEEGLNV